MKTKAEREFLKFKFITTRERLKKKLKQKENFQEQRLQQTEKFQDLDFNDNFNKLRKIEKS